MPKPLHEQLHNAAEASGRSYNAEIVARLQQSFDSTPVDDPNVKRVVEEFAKLRDMSYRDALMLLVTAGSQPDAPQIVHIRVGAGATMQEVKEIIKEAANVAHPGASVIYESGGWGS